LRQLPEKISYKGNLQPLMRFAGFKKGKGERRSLGRIGGRKRVRHREFFEEVTTNGHRKTKTKIHAECGRGPKGWKDGIFKQGITPPRNRLPNETRRKSREKR